MSKHIAEPLRWNKMGTRMVSIPYVVVADRIIPPTKARIDVMAERLRERGQLVPILVWKGLGDRWMLVAGATRLAAAKQLGWEEIEATVIAADNEYEYGLIEIAENLDRHDLSESERKQLKAEDKKLRTQRLAQLKELLKNPHPAHQEPKPERQHKATGKPKGRPKGGVRDAARKAGIPKSTAQDHAKAISPAGQKSPQLGEMGIEVDPAGSTSVAGNDVDAAVVRKARYAEPETYSPESWAALTPKKRKLVVEGWGPGIITAMSVAAICGCMTAEQRVEFNKRASHRAVKAVDEVPLGEKQRAAVKKAIEHQPEADEPLSEKEAKAVASAINAANNCTDQGVQPDGNGGLVMVEIDEDGAVRVDCKPQNFALADAADYGIDAEEIRRRVAAANIHIKTSSEKMH